MQYSDVFRCNFRCVIFINNLLEFHVVVIPSSSNQSTRQWHVSPLVLFSHKRSRNICENTCSYFYDRAHPIICKANGNMIVIRSISPRKLLDECCSPTRNRDVRKNIWDLAGKLVLQSYLWNEASDYKCYLDEGWLVILTQGRQPPIKIGSENSVYK